MPRPKRDPNAERTVWSGSLTDILLRLQPGQEHVVVRHLNPQTDDLSEKGISTIRSKLNSTVSKTLWLLRQSGNGNYSVESVVFSTTRNRMYAALVITRDA